MCTVREKLWVGSIWNKRARASAHARFSACAEGPIGARVTGAYLQSRLAHARYPAMATAPARRAKVRETAQPRLSPNPREHAFLFARARPATVHARAYACGGTRGTHQNKRIYVLRRTNTDYGMTRRRRESVKETDIFDVCSFEPSGCQSRERTCRGRRMRIGRRSTKELRKWPSSQQRAASGLPPPSHLSKVTFRRRRPASRELRAFEDKSAQEFIRLAGRRRSRSAFVKLRRFMSLPLP